MKYTVALLFIFINSILCGQNLVPNGSFEEGESCPEIITFQEGELNNWFLSIQYPDMPDYFWPSADWFHSCSSNEIISTPNTIAGFQQPQDGDAYIGVITRGNPGQDYREIVGVELNESLEVDASYLVSFYISTGTGPLNGLASNKFGVKFSSLDIVHEDSVLVNNSDHFNIDSIVTDTTSWLHVEFEFTADSSYSFLHLGNFHTDNNTMVQESGTSQNDQAYYFIDDVSVSSTLSTNTRKSLSYQVYPNPASNYLQISGITSASVDIMLLTLAGKKVLETQVSQTERLDISSLPAGTYILSVQNKQRIENHKIVKL